MFERLCFDLNPLLEVYNMPRIQSRYRITLTIGLSTDEIGRNTIQLKVNWLGEKNMFVKVSKGSF